MLTKEQVTKLLSDRNLRRVAAETGLSYGTLINMRNGKINDPSHRVMVALDQYLRRPQ